MPRLIILLSICDGKSNVFFFASVFVMKGVRRSIVAFRLSGKKGTEDVEAVVIKDHLLCSGVVLSFD